MSRKKLYLLRPARTLAELQDHINGVISLQADRAKITIHMRATHARLMVDLSFARAIKSHDKKILAGIPGRYWDPDQETSQNPKRYSA